MISYRGTVPGDDGSRVDFYIDHFPPRVPPRMTIGWCPGQRSTEGPEVALRRMLAAYPGSEFGALRIFFQPGEAAGSWTSGPLPLVPSSADLIVSSKDWPFDVRGWLDAMPQRTGRTWLCIHHEPEQQTGDDPTPAVYKRNWGELVATLETHPRRGELGLMPIFTRFYWAKNAGAYDQFFPTAVTHRLAAVGWDCYDQLARRTAYETPESILRTPVSIITKTGLPIAICEAGIKRVDADTDGLGCANALYAFADYSRRAGVLAWCWYHKDLDQHHDLTNAPVRAPEAAALRVLIADQGR